MEKNTQSISESSSDNFKLPMICIVLGFLSGLFGFISGIPSIIVGHIALRKAKKNNFQSNLAYKRMAIFGLCLGYNGTLMSIYALKIIYDVFLI